MTIHTRTVEGIITPYEDKPAQNPNEVILGAALQAADVVYVDGWPNHCKVVFHTNTQDTILRTGIEGLVRLSNSQRVILNQKGECKVVTRDGKTLKLIFVRITPLQPSQVSDYFVLCYPGTTPVPEFFG